MRGRYGSGWRAGVPLVCALAGMLAMTSMLNARGTDLRGGRYTDLPSLVNAQRREVADLDRQAARVENQVQAIEHQITSIGTRRIDAAISRLRTPAGLVALAGPGLVVTLDDAPPGEQPPRGTDPNFLVVHQQDLQAVINALWVGGAEGISLQSRRIVSTTGVKCVGNTVVLQGVPYAPPYRIVAVGDVASMYAGLHHSPEVRNYLAYTAPPYNLGWSIRSQQDLHVPAFTGTVGLRSARPLS